MNSVCSFKFDSENLEVFLNTVSLLLETSIAGNEILESKCSSFFVLEVEMPREGPTTVLCRKNRIINYISTIVKLLVIIPVSTCMRHCLHTCMRLCRHVFSMLCSNSPLLLPTILDTKKTIFTLFPIAYRCSISYPRYLLIM